MDGFFVVADDVGDGTTFVPDADLILNFDFQNGPDSVVLHDAGLVLDSVGYGVFGVGEIFAGEGEPAPDAPAGSSLAPTKQRDQSNQKLTSAALDFGV